MVTKENLGIIHYMTDDHTLQYLFSLFWTQQTHAKTHTSLLGEAWQIINDTGFTILRWFYIFSLDGFIVQS